MITAKVIADSKNPFGNRITTMIVTMPRYILAEFNTHRMFSRNSASSRAIPFEKMLKSIEENPFIPIAWMKDHKGMQGTEYFTEKDKVDFFNRRWLETKKDSLNNAVYLSAQGVTKQLINRLLEPFMYHTVIVTATEWENFFALRCPKYQHPEDANVNDISYRSKKNYLLSYPDCNTPLDNQLAWLTINSGQADIHMMATAEAMWDVYNKSTPKELKVGEWHIPFIDSINPTSIYDLAERNIIENTNEAFDATLIKIATASCARVSYTVVGEEDKMPNAENDIKLHDRLAASGHWSPFEHCAKSMSTIEAEDFNNPLSFSGNFRGFIQYRKTFNNENIAK